MVQTINPQFNIPPSDVPEVEKILKHIHGRMHPGQLEQLSVLGASVAPDSEFSGRGIPNYLGAPAISPQGTEMRIPSKQDACSIA